MAKDYATKPGATIEPVTVAKGYAPVASAITPVVVSKRYAAKPEAIDVPVVSKDYSPDEEPVVSRGSGKAYTAAGLAMRERAMLEEGMIDA